MCAAVPAGTSLTWSCRLHVMCHYAIIAVRPLCSRLTPTCCCPPAGACVEPDLNNHPLVAPTKTDTAYLYNFTTCPFTTFFICSCE